MFTRVLLDPQGGEGNGNSGGNGTGGGNVDLSAVVAGMLQKAQGDPTRVITKLLKENHRYRGEIQSLNAKLPGEKSVVLSEDDARRWEAYKSIGIEPGKIKESLDAGASAIEKWAGHERGLTYERAADVGGYSKPLFKRLAAQDKLTFDFEKTHEGGKEVEKAFVVSDDGKTRTPIKDYVSKNWSDVAETIAVPADTARKPGTPGRANDNPPPPKPGAGVQPDMVAAIGGMARYGI